MDSIKQSPNIGKNHNKNQKKKLKKKLKKQAVQVPQNRFMLPQTKKIPKKNEEEYDSEVEDFDNLVSAQFILSLSG